jgi:hypothetical protein
MRALLLVLLLLPAEPALAADESKDAGSGVPKAILVLAVVAVVFALVWREVSRRKQR